jgi:hypothetical protein
VAVRSHDTQTRVTGSTLAAVKKFLRVECVHLPPASPRPTETERSDLLRPGHVLARSFRWHSTPHTLGRPVETSDSSSLQPFEVVTATDARPAMVVTQLNCADDQDIALHWVNSEGGGLPKESSETATQDHYCATTTIFNTECEAGLVGYTESGRTTCMPSNTACQVGGFPCLGGSSRRYAHARLHHQCKAMKCHTGSPRAPPTPGHTTTRPAPTTAEMARPVLVRSPNPLIFGAPAHLYSSQTPRATCGRRLVHPT